MGKFARTLAIDLGASSGRGIVFEIDGKDIRQTEVHRFANGAVEKDGRLYWDLQMLFDEIVKAIGIADKKCGRLDSVGIDTWGVDFGLIGRDGNPIGDPRHYRDKANSAARISLQDKAFELFALAGVSDNDFNTSYQVVARIQEGEDFANACHLLFMPQLLAYMLTGVAVSEPTISSTSGFYTKDEGFSEQFCNWAGIPLEIFPDSVDTGAIIGNLSDKVKLAAEIDYDLPVIATAGHDTACAVLGIPTSEEYPMFLSSGTWSLFGAIEERAQISPEAFEGRYTNELAFDGKVRFLRNIMGMWIIQECRRQWKGQGMDLDYAQIVGLARQSQVKGAYIDVDDRAFSFPCDMADAVADYVWKNQGIKLRGVGDVAKCVYDSLVKAYAQAYDGLKKLTGRQYGKIYVIGGGSDNDYLNQLIADGLGITVSAGPTEASALGNALGQFVGLGVLNKSEIGALVANNYKVRIFSPRRI